MIVPFSFPACPANQHAYQRKYPGTQALLRRWQVCLCKQVVTCDAVEGRLWASLGSLSVLENTHDCHYSATLTSLLSMLPCS